MLIDCDTCAVRGPACGDCVVTVLLAAPPVTAAMPADEPHTDQVELDAAEQAAIAVLASSGLVPPLRLVQGGAEEGSPADRLTHGARGETQEEPRSRRNNSA